MDIHCALASTVSVDISKCALKRQVWQLLQVFFIIFFHFYRLIYFLAKESDVKIHCMIEKKFDKTSRKTKLFP